MAIDKINATALLDGGVDTADLADGAVTLDKLSATGTKDATTFLRGDNSFQVVDVNDVTGDFTVDTSTFVVDSTNDRVRVNAASNATVYAVGTGAPEFTTVIESASGDAASRALALKSDNTDTPSMWWINDSSQPLGAIDAISTGGLTLWGNDNQGDSWNQGLAITEDGYVTKPNIPAFNARSSPTSQSLGSGWQTVVYGAIVTQTGSHYNASTGVFTAPISGWYQFNAAYTEVASSDTDGTFSISVNGSTSTVINSVSMYFDGGGQHDGRVVSGSGYLSAGDNVRMIRYANVTTTARTSDQYAGWFSGYLIG